MAVFRQPQRLNASLFAVAVCPFATTATDVTVNTSTDAHWINPVLCPSVRSICDKELMQ